MAAWFPGLILPVGEVRAPSTVGGPACLRLPIAFQVRCGSADSAPGSRPAASSARHSPAAAVVNTAPGIPCPSSSAASVTSDLMLTPGDRCSAYSAEYVQVTAGAAGSRAG